MERRVRCSSKIQLKLKECRLAIKARVLPDNLGPSTLCITFHAHPSQGAFESNHAIFLCRDDDFSAFQLPLSGKELLP
jgi:hypothetical protein